MIIIDSQITSKPKQGQFFQSNYVFKFPIPPSSCKTLPVIQLLCSPKRNEVACAISFAFPILPSGWRLLAFSIFAPLFLFLIHLNHTVFKSRFVLIGVAQEMFTIPCILGQPLLFILAIIGLCKKKFNAPKYAYISIFFGVSIGLVRIVEGGHFLSDIVFSGLVVFLLSFFIKKLFLNNSHSWLGCFYI